MCSEVNDTPIWEAELVLQELKRMSGELRRELAGFEPGLVTPIQAASVLEAAAEVERLAGSIKLLAAKRASESRLWATEGHRSAASWIAEEKVSYGEAVSTLETAERLTSLPRTTEALKNGQLSRSQVKELAQAASSHSGVEGELLRVAAEGSVKKLRDHARQLRARAASKRDEVARYRAIHKRRYLRHWTAPEGDFHLEARLSPDTGARVLASVQAEADLLFEAARQSAEHEAAHAYAADALVSLVTGRRLAETERPPEGSSTRSGSGRARTDTVVVRVDAKALRRGYAQHEETCEIPGVGPIPVASAQRLLGDAFLKLLVTDGVDVTTVCHAGRGIRAHVQSALAERDRTCVVPGCEVANGLESHHWRQDYVKCQTTSLDGLARVCKRHHDLITYEGFTLTGGPGRWKLVPPGTAGIDTS